MSLPLPSPPPAPSADQYKLRILNADKPITNAKCQSVFVNALDALRKCEQTTEPLQSLVYLHAVYQTQRCDAFTDLSSTRAQVVNELGANAARRLIEPRSGFTQEDVFEARVLIQQHKTCHRSKLLSALNTSTKMRYHYAQATDKAASVVAACAALFGIGHARPPKPSTWRSYFPKAAPDDDGNAQHRADS